MTFETRLHQFCCFLFSFIHTFFLIICDQRFFDTLIRFVWTLSFLFYSLILLNSKTIFIASYDYALTTFDILYFSFKLYNFVAHFNDQSLQEINFLYQIIVWCFYRLCCMLVSTTTSKLASSFCIVSFTGFRVSYLTKFCPFAPFRTYTLLFIVCPLATINKLTISILIVQTRFILHFRVFLKITNLCVDQTNGLYQWVGLDLLTWFWH